MLTYQGKDFFLDDKKINVYSGAIHYFRVPPEYWEDRLAKLKAAGFNTVETYVCWNLHEKKPGEFDFSGGLDLVKFLETAQGLGLYSILRPGPYICAEWDNGGLPAWLLRDKNMRLRCMYKPFTDRVEIFFRELLPRLLPLMHTNGGSLIALQVENEYGSYGNDKNYLSFLENLIRDCGVNELLFTSDGPEDGMLSGGTLPHLLKAVNFGAGAGSAFKKAKEYQGFGAPALCGEYWDGWFDHFGEKHHRRPASTLLPDLEPMLKNKASFNFYMFHGGTSFGFSSGANFGGKYQPDITSYDYDALLNEWGGYTPKYYAVRAALLKHQGLPETALPPAPELQTIGDVKLDSFTSFMGNIETLGEKRLSVSPDYMESFGQNFGFICYRTGVKGKYHGRLFLDGLADRAYIFVNNRLKGAVWRNDKKQSCRIGGLSGETQIDILVEAMGRVNFGPEMSDRKGVRQIRIDNQVLSNWEVYTLPLDNLDKLTFETKPCKAPFFLRGEFETQSRADCFVHTGGFKKGCVFVNGFNLGRYWEAGPQEALYLPGTLLREKNELVILELEGAGAESVLLDDKPNLAGKRKRRLARKV